MRQEQELHVRAGILLHTEQAGRQHTGIVEHQAVARLQVLHKIAEMAVLQRARAAVHDHQPGSVARLDRRLRNQLLRQIVIKVTCLHIIFQFCIIPFNKFRLTPMPFHGMIKKNLNTQG